MTFMDVNIGSGLISTVGGFIASIAPIFSGLLAIYLLLWAFNYWANGSLVDMGVDFFKKLVAWSLLIAFAFNAGEYATLANVIYNLDTEISKSLSPSSAGYTGNSVDIVLDEIDGLANKLLDDYTNSGFFDKVGNAFQYLSNVAMLYLMGGLFLTVAFGLYIVAKGMLALTLLVGPIFLGLGLFPATRSYMTNWINQCFNNIFSCVLIGLVGLMQLKFLNGITPDRSSFDIMGAYAFNVALLISTIIFIILLFKVPNLTAALTGGAVGDGVGFTRLAAGRVSGIASAAKSIMNKTSSILSRGNKITSG